MCTDGKVRYGLVTAKGLLSFNVGDHPDPTELDFFKYRLRLVDYEHALFSVVVFAVVVLLADVHITACVRF
jgi:hypothetical protein